MALEREVSNWEQYKKMLFGNRSFRFITYRIAMDTDVAEISKGPSAEGSTRCACSKSLLWRTVPWYNPCHKVMSNSKWNLKWSDVFRDFILHFALQPFSLSCGKRTCTILEKHTTMNPTSYYNGREGHLYRFYYTNIQLILSFHKLHFLSGQAHMFC